MINKFIEYLFTYRFGILLATLFGMIFIPVFFNNLFIRNVLSYSFITMTLIVSILIFKNMKRHKTFVIFSLFVLGVIFMNWLDFFVEGKRLILVPRLILILSLYIVIFVNIFNVFKSQDEVDIDSIFGAIAAFLILGIMGAFTSTIIEIYYPGSFNFPQSSTSIQTHLYFNFVTLTTLGYGDIVPKSPQGQTHTVFMAIVGQLYLTITIGLIVGRYLVRKDKNSN